MCVAVISVLVASLFTYMGTLKASHSCHDFMLDNLLRNPISFFDITPVGRVLNRFSKDVDTMDVILPMTLRGWTTCFFGVGTGPFDGCTTLSHTTLTKLNA
jgi:ATP-binding cassette, subfamily C (CFTR/MRP), member 1